MKNLAQFPFIKNHCLPTECSTVFPISWRNSIIYSYLFLLVILGSALSFSISAQSFKPQEVKAALVGKIINNIEWQTKTNDQAISIAVYKDKVALSTLKLLESVQLKNAPVSVTLINTLNKPQSFHVVYVAKTHSSELTNIISAFRSTNTLVISEDSPSLHNIMINIVSGAHNNDAKQTFDFQINRPNLTFEKLTPLPNLVLIGGSELDVAQLYRETEQAIAKLQRENQTVFQQLTKRDQELAQKKSQLTQRDQQLALKESRLTQLETQAKQLSDELTIGQQALRNVEQRAKTFEENALNAQTQYQQALAQAELFEQKLAAAQQQFSEQTQAIEEQLSLLSSLKKEVNDNRALLIEQSSALKRKETQVTNQAQVISKQNQTIDTVIIVITIFILITLLVTYLFIKNKLINKNLKATLIELESTQSQLVESEKLAALGGLVAGVAHELNTPLGISLTAVTTIGDNATALKHKVDSGNLKKSDLDQFLSKFKEVDLLIQNNLERCHTLIQSFKQISSDQIVSESRKIQLKDYISDIMHTLSVILKKNQASYTVQGDNPQVSIDPGILNQVINNLTTNAMHHAFIDQENKQITIEIKSVDGKVSIEFHDNGVGMDAQTRQKIFDPFFTTKRGKGGTGLGMNIVHNLVTTKLNGEITLLSELGKGSQFKISFPV